MSAPYYSFIVATLGRQSELEVLLVSLKEQTFQDYEIIVVDQNMHDRVQTLCSNYKKTKHFHAEKGLSLARNKGIKKASGRFLIFPDDDAKLKPGFLENANALISNMPYISIFSGIVLTLEKDEPFSRYMDFRSEEITFHNFDKFMSTTMIIDKKVFTTIGGFDEEMGLGARLGGSEEAELLLRSLAAGFKAYYSSTLVAYHPEVNFSGMLLKATVRKGYNYGLGRGALFRKLSGTISCRWILGQWTLSLIKSIGGIIVSGTRGQWKNSIRHCAALGGRITGFFIANN